MPLAQKLDRLSKSVSEEQQAMREEKLRKWERIKSDAPEIAGFLSEINAVFGKPKRVGVWIGEERIL